MHSPMKNQQPTSAATAVFTAHCVIVRCLNWKVTVDKTNFAS